MGFEGFHPTNTGDCLQRSNFPVHGQRYSSDHCWHHHYARWPRCISIFTCLHNSEAMSSGQCAACTYRYLWKKPQANQQKSWKQTWASEHQKWQWTCKHLKSRFNLVQSDPIKRQSMQYQHMDTTCGQISTKIDTSRSKICGNSILLLSLFLGLTCPDVPQVPGPSCIEWCGVIFHSEKGGLFDAQKNILCRI